MTETLPVPVETPNLPAVIPTLSPEVLETVLVDGDLRKLTPSQRSAYYQNFCWSLGINHLTRPFGYIVLNDKLTLYAFKGATDQLRRVHGISLSILSRERDEESGTYLVTARATMPSGRSDEDVGAVAFYKTEYDRQEKKTVSTILSGETAANAKMKAETKAKRRVTLSICGLGGVLDESELDTVKGYKKVAIEEVEAVEEAVVIEAKITPDQYKLMVDMASVLGLSKTQLALRTGSQDPNSLKTLSVTDYSKVMTDLKNIAPSKKSTASA